MADYLYKSTVYFDTTDVIGIDPVQEEANKVEFEANYKASVYQVDDIQIAETVFVLNKSYADFKALIDGEVAWTDVKMIQQDKYYELFILSATQL